MSFRLNKKPVSKNEAEKQLKKRPLTWTSHLYIYSYGIYAYWLYKELRCYTRHLSPPSLASLSMWTAWLGDTGGQLAWESIKTHVGGGFRWDMGTNVTGVKVGQEGGCVGGRVEMVCPDSADWIALLLIKSKGDLFNECIWGLGIWSPASHISIFFWPFNYMCCVYMKKRLSEIFHGLDIFPQIGISYFSVAKYLRS